MSALEYSSNHYGELYGALDKSNAEIRLAHLNASTEPSSKIQCQLEVCSLAAIIGPRSYQTFEALSYTWGDPSIVEEIFVNDQSFSITSNLEALLRQRREPDKPISLWIDAICINQSDLQEKNQQIPLMSLIYASASKLTIWLGSASIDSRSAIDQLRLLGSGSPYDKMLPIGRTQVQQIQRLLSRPWWTRVWVVQELVLGGASVKMDRVSVHCGPDSLSWMNLVIAAARMKAYEDNQRETFPMVSTILELDSLRENPRDKIYGIYKIFSTNPSERIQPKYEAEVNDVYLDFAVAALSSEIGLETLRHCGAAALAVPSWVPDWSVPLTCEPLPIRRIPRYFDVPWWAEPERIASDRDYNQWGEPSLSKVTFKIPGYPLDPSVMDKERRNRLNRLRIGAEGSGRIHSLEEVPPGFTLHQASSEIKSTLEDVLQSGNLILFVQDERVQNERCKRSETSIGNFPKPAHPLRQGEIITERRTKSWLLRELDHLSCAVPTRPKKLNQTNLSINREEKTLTLDGIPWDTVEICHEGFVNDVTQDWWNATRFMVAVGCCKKLALNSKSARKRYSSEEELLESFWLTLFAGQITGLRSSPGAKDGRKQLRYTEWLPCVPQSWAATSPRTTISNSGHLRLVEGNEVTRKVCKELGSRFFNGEDNFVVTSLPGFSWYIPEDWTESDKRQQEVDINYLGSLWHQQPYDLYHRPFDLPHTVPDPYWEVRNQEDELAMHLMREHDFPYIWGLEPSKEQNSHISEFTIAEANKYWRSVPSIVPQGTLDQGIEQFALGRKFFITKKGYFGIGPQQTEPGDRVIAIFGSEVPFILRKESSKDFHRGLKLIGETYVHGVMNGEIIAQWKSGLVESGKIVLV